MKSFLGSRQPGGEMGFGLVESVPWVKIAPLGWMGKFRVELIRELINAVMNVILFWEPGAVCACLGEGQRVWLGSVSPSMRFVSQQR